jgi:hypothetical protein
VVVVQVAPPGELVTPGLVASTAVPAAIWTVDSDSGRVDTAGQPPGSPSGAEVRRAGAALAQGLPAPSLGELDHAEREIMQMRSVAMPPALGGVAGILLFIFAIRYGFGALFSLFILSSYLRSAQGASATPGGPVVIYGELLVNLLILVGIVVGVGVLFNIRNLAFRLPGFSSPVPRARTMTWVGYGAVMVLLAVMLDVVLPGAAGSAARNAPQDSYLHVKVTTADDGSEAYVMVGGDLTVDLASWPSSEWSGVTFKTSNPSILSLDQTPPAGSDPIAVFTARLEGTSRVDAASADGRYTFQLRVVTASASPP